MLSCLNRQGSPHHRSRTKHIRLVRQRIPQFVDSPHSTQALSCQLNRQDIPLSSLYSKVFRCIPQFLDYPHNTQALSGQLNKQDIPVSCLHSKHFGGIPQFLDYLHNTQALSGQLNKRDNPLSWPNSKLFQIFLPHTFHSTMCRLHGTTPHHSLAGISHKKVLYVLHTRLQHDDAGVRKSPPPPPPDNCFPTLWLQQQLQGK